MNPAFFLKTVFTCALSPTAVVKLAGVCKSAKQRFDIANICNSAVEGGRSGGVVTLFLASTADPEPSTECKAVSRYSRGVNCTSTCVPWGFPWSLSKIVGLISDIYLTAHKLQGLSTFTTHFWGLMAMASLARLLSFRDSSFPCRPVRNWDLQGH